MSSVPFCTCPDHACPCNPVNHDKGCVLCVAKCLNENEIPVCFFRKIEPDMDRMVCEGSFGDGRRTTFDAPKGGSICER